MIVRRAVRTDAQFIAALMLQLGYDAPADLVIGKLDRFENSADNVVFVADAGDRLLGCVSAHALELFHVQGRLGRITSLVVDQSARGSGVGQALVAAATRFCADIGCIRIEVTSGEHRPAAHSFYKAIGFEEDERRYVMRLT
jgi:GNAT superfamily N-acetyltransferase